MADVRVELAIGSGVVQEKHGCALRKQRELVSEYNENLDELRREAMYIEEFAPANAWDALLDIADFDEHRARGRAWQPSIDLTVRRGTIEELREMKILEWECPLPGCSSSLDADFFCSSCGNVSLPKAAPLPSPHKQEEAA